MSEPADARPMTWIVYILECADRSLYTGITTDLIRRIRQHEAGTGAKYTRNRGPFTVRHTERMRTKSRALRREAAIKALDRSAKLALVTAATRRTGRRASPPGLSFSATARRPAPAASA